MESHWAQEIVTKAQTTSEDSIEKENVETEETKPKEKPPAPKQKDKLYKRIWNEMFRDKNEVDDDPLDKDPKFLVWKISLKLFILTGLYLSYRRLPANIKPMYRWYAGSYAFYLVVTLIMWLYKCFEAFTEYLDKIDYNEYQDSTWLNIFYVHIYELFNVIMNR